MMVTVFIDADNKRDVLARVVMLFHRRAITIHSLVMVSGDGDDMLRMTIEAEFEETQSVRIVANLYKLVNVRFVTIKNSLGQSAERIHPLVDGAG